MSPGAPMMLAEAAALAGDVAGLVAAAAEQVSAALRRTGVPDRVHLVGDGDSHHAGRAAESAVRSLGATPCQALPALPFLVHGPRTLELDGGRALVVGVSASGRTPKVLDALRAAAAAGAATLAVTGTAGCELTDVADASVVLDLGPRDPSPGIRTHQASLVGLLSLAIGLGEARGAHPATRSRALHDELRDAAAAIGATDRAAGGPAEAAAAVLASAPAAVVLGTGPATGTALHVAAKLVEGSGLFAVAQDSEEWMHVERFAFPRDMPVLVLAPPGPGRERTVEVAARAAGLGRRVIGVAAADDPDLPSCSTVFLPVAGGGREELAPLRYGVPAARLAHHVALRSGRSPFAAGRA